MQRSCKCYDDDSEENNSNYDFEVGHFFFDAQLWWNGFSFATVNRIFDAFHRLNGDHLASSPRWLWSYTQNNNASRRVYRSLRSFVRARVR